MDDKVKIRCPACTHIFRENASRVREGEQVNCRNCNKLITLTKETGDQYLRRALKAAREVRLARDEAAQAIYSRAALAPKRETP
jgi:hypothetical protein